MALNQYTDTSVLSFARQLMSCASYYMSLRKTLSLSRFQKNRWRLLLPYRDEGDKLVSHDSIGTEHRLGKKSFGVCETNALATRIEEISGIGVNEYTLNRQMERSTSVEALWRFQMTPVKRWPHISGVLVLLLGFLIPQGCAVRWECPTKMDKEIATCKKVDVLGKPCVCPPGSKEGN